MNFKQENKLRKIALIAAGFSLCAFEIISKDALADFKDKPANDLKAYTQNYITQKNAGNIVDTLQVDSVSSGPKNMLYTSIGPVACSLWNRWEVSTSLFCGDSTIFLPVQKQRDTTETKYLVVKTPQQYYNQLKLNNPYLSL